MTNDQQDTNSCFVVMPITVPKHLLESRYGSREDHFQEIYRALIAPAVELAGLAPSAPKRVGTENIQAGVINDLRASQLVLADLSALNPNVFLELGIRSALDKPVCLVWDGADRLPFDTGTLNTYRYNPSPVYELNDEIQEMADHISATLEKSDGRNELWKFFGRASEIDLSAAELDPSDASMASKLDRLLELAEMPRPRPEISSTTLAALSSEVAEILKDSGSNGVHGHIIGKITRRHLGPGYDAFVAGRSLSAVLRSLGVPIETDDSGVFYLARYRQVFQPDSSIATILEELKERGIG